MEGEGGVQPGPTVSFALKSLCIDRFVSSFHASDISADHTASFTSSPAASRGCAESTVACVQCGSNAGSMSVRPWRLNGSPRPIANVSHQVIMQIRSRAALNDLQHEAGIDVCMVSTRRKECPPPTPPSSLQVRHIRHSGQMTCMINSRQCSRSGTCMTCHGYGQKHNQSLHNPDQ